MQVALVLAAAVFGYRQSREIQTNAQDLVRETLPQSERAALLAGRGYILSANGTALSICRDKACEPASGLEAAAFIVIGAAMPRKGIAERPITKFFGRRR